MRSPSTEVPQPPRTFEPHPAVDEALRALTARPDGAYELSAEGAKALRAVAARLKEPAERALAARALARLAWVLDVDARSPRAAAEVVEVARALAS